MLTSSFLPKFKLFKLKVIIWQQKGFHNHSPQIFLNVIDAAHMDFCGVHPNNLIIKFGKQIQIGCINVLLDCYFEKDGSRLC